MKRLIFALVAVAMLFTAMQVNAQGITNTVREINGEMVVISTTDGRALQRDTTGITAFSDDFPAPSNPHWGENYEIHFGELDFAEGMYHVLLYKDDVLISDLRHYLFDWYNQGFLTAFCHKYITDSGVYRFEVAGIIDAVFDPSVGFTYECGEYAESSITYTKPAEALGTATNLRWEQGSDRMILHWDLPPDVDENAQYDICLYKLDDLGEPDIAAFTYGMAVHNHPTYFDGFNSNWGFTEPGTYFATVRLLSGRLDEIASGVEAESPYYDLAEVVVNIGRDVEYLFYDVLDGFVSPEEARDTLASMNNHDLAVAMQGDPAVLDDIKSLEYLYNSQKGISVSRTVADEIDLDADKISVVGAGFNTSVFGQDMKLNFTVPNEQVVVNDSQYKNWVQFNIDLDGRDTPAGGELDVPVQITMPIPAGVSLIRFVILHYKADGSYDTIHPILNLDDGTATFTVTRFSVFVFANGVDDGFPATGVSSHTTQSMLMLGLFAVAVVLFGVVFSRGALWNRTRI